MGPPLPLVDTLDAVEVAFDQLQQGPAVIVTREGQALGVLTRSDLLEFLAHRRRTGA
jgi:predicted transcriptional regulator